MGFLNTQTVLEGLAGKDLSIETTNARTGKKSVKRLSAQDMALLLVVAARQADPMAYHNDPDPLWYANAKTICDFAHFGESTLYESRNLLVRLGLLRYSKCEQHMDYQNPRRTRTYTNVYRIGLDRIRQLQMESGDEVRVAENCPRQADEKLRNTEKCVPHAGEKLRNTEKYLPHAEEKLRNTEKKLRNTETQIDTTNRQQQTNSVSVVDKSLAYVEGVRSKIAEELGVPAGSIVLKVLAEAIRGKFPDTVFRTIRDAGGWFRHAENPVRALISTLRQLPEQGNDPAYQRKFNPTVDQLLEAVSADIRCVVGDAMRNTGCRESTFIRRLLPLLIRHFATPEGREFVLETIYLHKTGSGERPTFSAARLLAALDR